MENNTKPAGTAKLELDGKTYDFPVLSGTHGPNVVDVKSLYGQAGVFTLDPGFTSTASCESQITFIDGENGILRYRGIPIEELAEKSNFLEVAYLLMYGSLPNADQLSYFTGSINHHTMLHEDFRKFYASLPKDAHPMAACSAAVGALATFYPDSLDPRDER